MRWTSLAPRPCPYGLRGRKATLNEHPSSVRPGFMAVVNTPFGGGVKGWGVGVGGRGVELRNCVKVEVAVLGSPSLIVLTVSVEVKQH